jgi:hypothetical protein
MYERFPFMKAGPVDAAEIDAASQELAMPFPSDYRDFLCRYGGAMAGPYPIFGVRRAAAMAQAEGSVVEITRSFKEKRWPGIEGWAIFSMDHAGNPIGLDKEGRVWISDHDFGVVEAICDSFEDYLRKRCLKLD